ncbi:MAG: restriction endonuclease [Dehalococcoidia bacterium]
MDTLRNRFNPARSQEIDIVLWNDRVPAGLWFLPEILLVECKNWTNPTGSAEVAWFDHKIRSLGQEYGILIAANGITGDRRRLDFAHDIVRYALGQRRRLLVVTAADLRNLTRPAEISELLKRKLFQQFATSTSIG